MHLGKHKNERKGKMGGTSLYTYGDHLLLKLCLWGKALTNPYLFSVEFMHEKGFYKTTLHLRPQWDCLFTREMKRFVGFLHPSKSKPYLGVVFVQLGYAGMTILAKTALDKGMSQYVFVAYRQIVATIVFVPFAIIFDRFFYPFFLSSFYVWSNKPTNQQCGIIIVFVVVLISTG